MTWRDSPPRLTWPLEDLVGHLRGDVAAEDLLDVIAFPEPGGHLVQRRGESACDVATLQRHAPGQVAGADAMREIAQRVQRLLDRSRHLLRDDQAGEQHEHDAKEQFAAQLDQQRQLFALRRSRSAGSTAASPAWPDSRIGR